MSMMKHVPNSLSLFRMAVTPLIAALMLYSKLGQDFGFWAAAAGLFLLAALTDAFDGALARRYDIVSDFGKFIDPIADKFLVISVMIAFLVIDSDSQLLMVWPVLIVLAREFIIMSVRLPAAAAGIVMPANIWGKAKTVTQLIAIAAYFVFFPAGHAIVGQVLIWISAVIAFISAATYVADYRRLRKG